MEAFDFEKALAGGKVFTRCGKPANIIDFEHDEHPDFPIRAMIDDAVWCFTYEGKVFNADADDEYDLMLASCCDECGEELVTCESCEKQGCPECGEKWSNKWYMDDEGIWLCPDCLSEAQKEYNEQTKNGTEVCESCSLYGIDEGTDEGYCEFHQEWRRPKDYCEDRLPKVEPSKE